MTREHVRQGDVLLVPVRAPKGGAAALGPVLQSAIIAYGESTGHTHAVEHAQLAQLGAVLYLYAPTPTCIRHEEHGEIPLAPGWYEYVPQVEWDPTAVRPVVD